MSTALVLLTLALTPPAVPVAVALTNSCSCSESGVCLCHPDRCVCDACPAHLAIRTDRPTTITVPVTPSRPSPGYRVIPSPIVAPAPHRAAPAYYRTPTAYYRTPTTYYRTSPAVGGCVGGSCAMPARGGRGDGLFR